MDGRTDRVEEMGKQEKRGERERERRYFDGYVADAEAVSSPTADCQLEDPEPERAPLIS